MNYKDINSLASLIHTASDTGEQLKKLLSTDPNVLRQLSMQIQSKSNANSMDEFYHALENSDDLILEELIQDAQYAIKTAPANDFSPTYSEDTGKDLLSEFMYETALTATTELLTSIVPIIKTNVIKLVKSNPGYYESDFEEDGSDITLSEDSYKIN